MVFGSHSNDHGGTKRKLVAPLVIVLVSAAALVCFAAPARAQSDDVTGPPAETLDNLTPPSASSWERIDGPDYGGADGQVLEVPQVVDPNDTAADAGDNGNADAGGDANAGSTDGAQVQTADGSGNGNNAEQDPDQIGSINDYQTEQSELASSGFYVVVPMQPLGVRPPLGVYPPTGILPPAGGGMLGSRPIMIPPRSVGPFPSTSPMLMPPRMSGSISGGWWTRARR
jgi:hypothetical protein